MAIGRKQIGWSQESSLLWEISRQMEKLSGVVANSSKYKVYVALLTQVGENAPTAVVIENTLGFDVTWNWANDGYYSTNELFDQTKTYTSITNNSFNTNLKTLGIGVLGPNDPVTVYSGDNNDILVNTPIEIRVYQ